MSRRFALAGLVAAAAFLPCAAVHGQEKAEAKITYADDVQPILREHCFTCHNQNKAQNDLALDNYDRLMTGGASGAVISPGDPDGSYLWGLVSHKEQPNMPPNQGKIADAKLETIRKWILGGALKDKGAKAQIQKKKGLEMDIPAGAGKPEGEPAMPEGLTRQPPVSSSRPGAVTAIAASPWAPLAAIAGQQQIVLYHTDTAQLLGILPYPEGIPFSLRFNRAGSLLLAAGGRGASLGDVAVYDVKTGKRAFQVGDELDVVLAADINPSNTLIALGGPQKIVRVYSTADGSLVTEIKKHTDWIYAVEFSPDGVLLATGDRSGGLWVWEAGTDREFYNLDGHKAPITAISWRADSNVLASASEDGTIKYWNMIDGKQIRSINAHSGGVMGIQFTRDGRLASVGRDRVVKLWDIDGKQIRAFDAFNDVGLEVALTHDGGRVIAGDWTGEIRMWDTGDGKLVANLASNPPTLEMRLQSAQAKAAESQAASDKAAAEAAAARNAVAERQKAADEAAATAAQKAEEAKAAAQKLEAAKAALTKANDDKQAAEKAVADATAASQQAAQAAAAAKTAADQKAAEVDPLKKAWLEKALAAQLAAKAAEEAKQAAVQAAAEKAAYDQTQKQG